MDKIIIKSLSVELHLEYPTLGEGANASNIPFCLNPANAEFHLLLLLDNVGEKKTPPKLFLFATLKMS